MGLDDIEVITEQVLGEMQNTFLTKAKEQKTSMSRRLLHGDPLRLSTGV